MNKLVLSVIIAFVVISCKKDDVETFAPDASIVAGTLKQKIVTNYDLDYDTNEVIEGEVVTSSYNNGKITKVESNKGLWNYGEYKYDTNGLLVNYIAYDDFEYDSYPRLLEYRIFYKDGHVSMIERFDKDFNKVVFSQEYIYENNSIVSIPRNEGEYKTEFKMNEKGLCFNFIHSEGENVSREGNFSYDNKGNLSKISSVTPSTITPSEFKYLETKNPEFASYSDSYEALLLLMSLGIEFNKTNISGTFYGVRYDYSGLGINSSPNYRDKIYFDTNESSYFESDIFKFENTFDSEGRVTQEKYFYKYDGELQLSRVTDYIYN